MMVDPSTFFNRRGGPATCSFCGQAGIFASHPHGGFALLIDHVNCILDAMDEIREGEAWFFV